MDVIQLLLIVVACILFLIYLDVRAISKRMRQRFPTDAEEDHDWAMSDPAGHAEAHRKDR
jgi:hypothetical protein